VQPSPVALPKQLARFAHGCPRNLVTANGLLPIGRLDSDFGTLVLARIVDL
jgi:hypothetical protein